MFSLLRRARRRPLCPAPTHTFRPLLEVLEARDCPSGSLSMAVNYQPNHQVILYGVLSGEPNNAGQVIGFSGAASGAATTDSNGYYNVTLTASQLGQVNAVDAADPAATAQATLTSSASMMNNFIAVQDGGGYWDFKGQVTGAPTSGMVVNFGGLIQGQHINVNPDGTFDLYMYLAPNQMGIVTAQATDWWGDTSNSAMDCVST
jgi:hypothetical protein